MEEFQRELQRHITQYDTIQESEWKKITKYHQTISENRLTPIQHRIQHSRRNGSVNNTHKIRMALRPPRMDQQHTPRSHHTQSLAQTRNNH
jgi:hypothetical protein